ncbi:MAG: CDP-alcohol phosphatidyltransferase family protein, partial [Lachnospiraceae bacterium]|nr:CDP-alcohol phosphatidyltransferase family protein [Lachnospiraceae bacterium]
MRKQIPNILTSIRILCSILLLICQPFSSTFTWLYIFAGISDMLDGFTARHFHAVSSFGEKYDSLADVLFIGVCLLKLLPAIHLPLWGILWIALIAAIKAFNLWFSHAYHRNKLFLHTIANKITGA